MIPKHIHQIWIGDSCPYHLTDRWKDMHPGWEYTLWREDDLAKLEMMNRKHFDALTSPGAKSNIARFEIVYKYGGIYIDADIMCLRPLDDIFLSVPNGRHGSIHQYSRR